MAQPHPAYSAHAGKKDRKGTIMAVYWLKEYAAPTSEPISMTTARLHLRLDTSGSPPSHPDDSLVSSLITAVRQNAEEYTGLKIASGTFETRADTFEDLEISLQTWPVTSVVSVSYVDLDDQTQTLDSSKYTLDVYTRPARLKPTTAQSTFPAAKEVTIRFTAGYTDGQSPNPYPMPKPVEAAMLLMLGHLYDNREAVSDIQSYERPLGVTYLLNPYRIKMGL
jgi:uncharacterized phiE125 gp8 family phage protein